MVPSPWDGTNPAVGNMLAWKHWSNNDIVRTRRFEMYREALDDYRYVYKLRELAAEKDAQTQQDVEDLIATAIDDITVDLEDTSRAEYWRTVVAEEILQVQSLP